MTPVAANIFNIQKFSLHDGPGIRTTVFFKGCPLRCTWCANPESIRPGPQVLWEAAKCVRCGMCAGACRTGAIRIEDDKVAVAHKECTGCGACARACPEGALTLSGKEYGVEEILAICLQDRDFYDESGGGVTLSGGEVMMQPLFARELLRRLKEEGVHTAIETNGFVKTGIFRGVADAADLLLFDVKHYDGQKHIEGTGVDNSLILENLRWAIGLGKKVLVRTPVIPGYNDSLADAAGFAQTLAAIPVDTVQLLPFHQFGQNKYESLGMTYAMAALPQLHKEDLAAFREALLAAGMKEVIV